MKKFIVLIGVVIALAAGTVTVLAVSHAANPKFTVSCEGNSCSVQVPGAVLNEMNKTMSNSLSGTDETETAEEQAFFKGLSQLFEEPAKQHDTTTKDTTPDFFQTLGKLFQ
jgi:hypothetical protein